MLLTNLLVTVLQSTLIKRGDQSQLAVRVKRGGSTPRSSRACNVDQSSRKMDSVSVSLCLRPSPALFTGLIELL